MAIDSDRLRQAWRAELPQRWVLGLKGRDRLSEDASDVLERISTAGLPTLASTLQSTIQSLLPLISAAFEADHARVAWREEMRQLVKEALDLAWPSGIKESEVHGIIGRLSLDGIESVIQRIHKMSIPSTDEAAPLRIAALCAVPLPRLSQLACDVSELNRFFNSLHSSIQSQTRSVESEHALAQRHELIKRLEWES